MKFIHCIFCILVLVFIFSFLVKFSQKKWNYIQEGNTDCQTTSYFETAVSDHEDYCNDLSLQNVHIKNGTSTIYLYSTDKNINTGSHTDNKQKGLKSAVYFVNDNDGYLYNFEEKKSVKSVANTMCIIDSNVLHAGFTCTNSDRRLVINICYLPDETYSHNRS